MPFILLLAFIILPIVEIALIIQLGYTIGFWPTLGLIILTAVAGTYLLRQQGLSVMMKAQSKVESGGMPMQEAFDGVALLIAGALLLTPGVVTDAFGFLLLVPAFRKWASKAILNRIKKSGHFSFTRFDMDEKGETNTYHYETNPGNTKTHPSQPGQTGKEFSRDAQNAEILEETPPDNPGDSKPNPGSPWRK